MINGSAMPDKLRSELLRRFCRGPQGREIWESTALTGGAGLPFQERRTDTLRHEEHLLLEATVKRFRCEAAEYVGLTVKDRQKVPYDRWRRARFPAKPVDKAQISRHLVDAALGNVTLYRVQIVNRLGEAGEALSADERQIVDRVMEDVVADDGMQSDVSSGSI